jgi:hypothetical protein
LYEEESIPLSFHQILLDIFSKTFVTDSKKFLLSKRFLALIHKKVYSAKLKRNWNASMCVEK